MANTYTQIYIHVVLVVKWRTNLISKDWKELLYKYISGIITNKKQKLMIINGMPDHVHILLSLGPSINLSELVRDIKANSSKWINEEKMVNTLFRWQEGFGAFSVSPGNVKTVIEYIKNQEEHHSRKTFREEYILFLKESGVDYKEEYLFTEIKTD